MYSLISTECKQIKQKIVSPKSKCVLIANFNFQSNIKVVPQQYQMQEQTILIGLDLGNSWIQLSIAETTIKVRNCMVLQNTNVYLNKKYSNQCLMDLLYIADNKIGQLPIQNIAKYYHYNFKRAHNRNLLLKPPIANTAEEFHLQFPIALAIKTLFSNIPQLKLLQLEHKKIKVIVTVFEGQLNPFRMLLKNCLQLNAVNQYQFVNTGSCIAASYISSVSKHRDDTQVIAVLDFGDQGMSCSIHKLYFMDFAISECLAMEVSKLGGARLTELLCDYVVKQIFDSKGMNIAHNQAIMHRLKILCQQAKHTLSHNDSAFIRLDGLPDILVYGCQITLQQFHQCIQSSLKANITLVKSTISKYGPITKIILTGGSSNIPYFITLLSQSLKNTKIVRAESDWVSQGLLAIKSGKCHTLDVCAFDLKLEGDQKFSADLVVKGESIPLRKKLVIKFPSGQLTYSMKFYQNSELVASTFISERPRENKFNLYIEIDRNKLLNIYATTSQGLIKMQTNYMDIPIDQYQRYNTLLQQLDLHLQNQ